MSKKTYCNRHKRKKKFEKIINICLEYDIDYKNGGTIFERSASNFEDVIRGMKGNYNA